MKRAIVCIIVLCFAFHGVGQKMSVKGRWNIKTSYSLYKTFNYYFQPLFYIKGSSLFDEERYKKRSNPRIEINYGVLNWLEIGVYGGFMIYQYAMWPPPEYIINNEDRKDAFAPTFGINANVHILPFFVKNQKCKWDFYVPLRYGGTYLTKWLGDDGVAIVRQPVDNWDTVENRVLSENKYRHEYGAGLGGAYYIKNIIGFYMEVLGGQFSYWPELVKSPYAIRFGLTAKF